MKSTVLYSFKLDVNGTRIQVLKKYTQYTGERRSWHINWIKIKHCLYVSFELFLFLHKSDLFMYEVTWCHRNVRHYTSVFLIGRKNFVKLFLIVATKWNRPVVWCNIQLHPVVLKHKRVTELIYKEIYSKFYYHDYYNNCKCITNLPNTRDVRRRKIQKTDGMDRTPNKCYLAHRGLLPSA